MSNKNFPMKLHINPWRIILIFALSFLVLEFIFYSVFQPWYAGEFNPFTQGPYLFNEYFKAIYIYTPILLIMSVVFCVLSIKNTYYIVESHYIAHFKMGHEDRYNYTDIIFIDEEWSKKHKMLQFYLKDGKSRTLAFDKEGLIFKYAVEKSHQISIEEFHAKFPNIKIG